VTVCSVLTRTVVSSVERNTVTGNVRLSFFFFFFLFLATAALELY